MFLLRVCSVLQKRKIPYAIVGGYAVALHGCVRGTVDLDIITKIELRNFEKIENAMKYLGLQCRLPVSAKEVFQFRKEYIKNRNLIAWNFYNPQNPLESVDIIITHSLDKLKVVSKSIENSEVFVLSISDLIKMKKASGRKQDLEDIAALEGKL